MPETESDPTPLSRIELLRLAQSLGVSDADVMTRAELRAAIENAKAPAPAPIEHPTTWVSVARRLLASVIERGLNLPDAAALIRGDAKLTTPPKAPPPVATVTLARIYAAQGHLDRAIATLDEVLESDPDHELARDLRAQLELRRQESVARDADAARIVRPEEELTPIMPEVVLREAAERGGTASVESPDPAAPCVAPELALDLRSREAASVASEPAVSDASPALAPSLAEAEPPAPALTTLVSVPSEPPGELVAPAFAVAERAEVSAHETHLHAQAIAEAVTHDSETPPAPSVSAFAEPESEVPTTLAAVEPSAPSSVEPHLGSEPSGDAEPLVPSEDWEGPSTDAAHAGVEPATAGAAESPREALGSAPEPAFHAAAAKGVENGVAYTPAHAVDPLAPSDGLAPLPPRAAEVLPEGPGLVLIEADQRQYLYWELGSSGAAPCWLHVVSHTPTVDGHTERRERRFPVQQRCGALRMEGVPADAVVRAKLSQDRDGKAVAVAGAVRSRDTSVEVRFRPHPRAPLEALARRAQPVLARATPVYWDC